MSNVELFVWNGFPLEYDSYFLTISIADEKHKKFFLNYITHIFPQKPIIGDIYKMKTDSDNPDNILVLDCDKLDLNWKDNLYLNKLYNNKNYIIVIGQDKNIPMISKTNSQVIIFDTKDDANKYMKKQKIDNWNEDRLYIVCDNRTYYHGEKLDKLELQIKFLDRKYLEKFE
jgi:hypothetical protein